MREDETTYPFWLGEKAEDGRQKIGLAEAWLEATVRSEIVGIDLSPVGVNLRRGDALGILHTGMGAHDLRLPLALSVLRINPEIAGDPALTRLSPYHRGWLAEVRIVEAA